MKIQELSETQKKIVQGMKLAYDRLLAERKRTDTPIIVSREGKILRVKPWEE